MYISLQPTLTAGRVKWPAFAELAHKLGYPGVDVSLREAMAFGVPATRSTLATLQLKPAVVTLPVEFRKDDDAFRSSLAKLDDAVQFSVAIGCPRFATWVPASSDTPKAELRKLYKARITACADVMARSHARLGLEYLGPLHIRRQFAHEFIWRMNEMLEFARECGPNVGLVLDSWHWHHAGATAADIVAAGRSGIVHAQINDAPDIAPELIRDNERLMPGEGIINLTAFLQALQEIGYQDGLSPEVFGRGLKNIPPEEGAKMGLETTRAAMRKAGVA